VTYDVIALTSAMPDLPGLMAALMATGEDLRVDTPESGGAIRLYTPDDEPILIIDAPTYLQVPGEARRLLGDTAASLTEPLWWIEIRAVERGSARAYARTLATALAQRLGGHAVTFDEPQP
jgi:hypothetical protein